MLKLISSKKNFISEETPAHMSHRKVEVPSAELKMKESLLDDDVDGHITSPSGAVLSLTMGTF